MLIKRILEISAMILFYCIIFEVGRKCYKNYILNGTRIKKLNKYILFKLLLLFFLATIAQFLRIPCGHLVFLGIAIFVIATKCEEVFAVQMRNKIFLGIGGICSFIMAVILTFSYETIFAVLNSTTDTLIIKNTWLIILLFCTVVLIMGAFSKEADTGCSCDMGLGILAAYIIGANFIIINFGYLVENYGMQRKLSIINILRNYITDPVYLLNILFVFVIGITIVCLVGVRLGTILNLLLLIFVFVANYIKLKYHSTFFSWFDLLQIKEMLLMGREFLGEAYLPVIILIAIVLILLIALFVKNLKKICAFLKIKCRALSTVLCVVLLIFVSNWILNMNSQSELGIYARTWENKTVNVRYNGLFVNLFLDFQNFINASMEEPDNYSEKEAQSLMNKFSNIGTSEEEQINPDVIVVLAESLFDLSAVPGIELDQEINSTIKEYSDIELISSRYGGYTSAIEFEVLTGMSLSFLPDALTPYTTYFNNENDSFPSIVENFKQNGYYTQVIHPDLEAFYNRDIVYSSFGFDNYQSIHQFKDVPEDMLTENGWVKDEYLLERVIDELGQSEDPQFLFLLTMEEHYVTLEKYSDTDVHVVGNNLSEENQNEIEQQAQSYYNTDQMLAGLIKYMDNTDKPTLLFVFGDHLPPLDYLSESGYIMDKDNKYKTAYIQYSNYKELPSAVEQITPNQIAANIVTYAGIEHYGYFDYIYDLQTSYPVLHKEYVDVESDAFDIYKFIQYDIMFGEQYLARVEEW